MDMHAIDALADMDSDDDNWRETCFLDRFKARIASVIENDGYLSDEQYAQAINLRLQYELGFPGATREMAGFSDVDWQPDMRRTIYVLPSVENERVLRTLERAAKGESVAQHIITPMEVA